MKKNMADRLRAQIYGRKAVGYLLLFAISMVFVFFGYSGAKYGMAVGSVARVNNSIISIADFQNEENRVQQYYSNMFGGAIDLSSQRQLLRQQALENLIRAELVSQGARAEGLPATDGEVREYILKDIPVFQENGHFQRERYSLYLDSTRSSAGDFESKIRKEIENQRTRRLFETSAAPLKLELDKIQELKTRKMNVGFVRLSDEELAKSIKVSDAEARQRLADPDFAKKAEEHFKAYEKDYSQEEQVRAQHILVQFKPGDAADEKKALTKATALRAKADKEDFGKLAKANSDDGGSKAKNGDLGFFGRGRMVKEFEDAAFAMKPGQISQPVKSPFGFHIIKLNEKKEAKKADFESTKVKVAQEMIAREKAGELTKNVEAAVEKGDQAAVDAALKAAGVSWDETGYFDLMTDSVPKVGSQVVSDAVFDLSPEKPMLPKVLRDGGAKYVVKYLGAKTEAVASAKPEQDREAVGRRRGDGMYMAWLNSMREKARIETNKQVLQ